MNPPLPSVPSLTAAHSSLGVSFCLFPTQVFLELMGSQTTLRLKVTSVHEPLGVGKDVQGPVIPLLCSCSSGAVPGHHYVVVIFI
ncbi:hypothetical protein DNTS_034845 [Danionella cerebrum]|uniref:Uncharacterized protein n=1 Tax=Danionella cerebrum TaxID=2873325 RepID=A0A553MLV9_9TELE|nr:hypothetical protein DNTS_034845 [Danionella translucida]